MLGFTAQHLLRRPSLGSIRSGILCVPIPLSKNSARKSRNDFTTDHTDQDAIQNGLLMRVSLILALTSERAFVAAVCVSLLIAPRVSAQTIVPSQVTTASTAEVERVIVTGSNIPTAEETGPNPVDTYRPQDIEKLG